MAAIGSVVEGTRAAVRGRRTRSVAAASWAAEGRVGGAWADIGLALQPAWRRPPCLRQCSGRVFRRSLS